MVNLIFSLASISPPTGLWPSIFRFIEGFVFSYGWVIVLFTLFVKLILSPFDFYTRYSTRKNNLIQKRLSGQVLKINQKFSSNREEANRQVAALYKKEGYNMIGSCVFMLINLVVTLVVFFGFFNSLKAISSYKVINQYGELHQTYYTELEKTNSIEAAEAKTLEAFLEINDKNSFLWIENIWRKDSKVDSIPSYNDLVEAAKNSKNEEYVTFVNSISETEYNKVMASVKSENRSWNGFFILAALVAVTSLLQQYLTEKSNGTTDKDKNQDPMTAQSQNTMKIMKLVLPIILIIFVTSNTASFGIYVLVGNIWGILTNLLFGVLVKKLTKKEEQKYLDYLQKESLKNNKKPQQKPKMVTYKNLGDKLWTR